MPYRLFPDEQLVALTGTGNQAAFAQLWRRHRDSAYALAKSVNARADAEDAVSEAYARVFSAIRGGGGPKIAFRAYLMQTTRNIAADWQRQPGAHLHEDLDVFEDPTGEPAHGEGRLDSVMACSAFQGLPANWRQVLWYVDVEGMPAREVAALMGMSSNAVAALTYRARDGLRQAWIREHLDHDDPDPKHQWAVQTLTAATRRTLPVEQRSRLETHLRDRPSCSLIRRDLARVSPRFREMVLSVLIGIAAAGLARFLHAADHFANAAAITSLVSTSTNAVSTRTLRVPRLFPRQLR